MSRHRKHVQPQPRAVQEPRFPAPTPEFRAKHDTLSPEISRSSWRPNWSVTSRFMRLNPDRAAVEAATWWRNTWDIASGIKPGRTLERVDCDGAAHDGISASQLTAHKTLRIIAADLGRTYTQALVYSLVMDMPWTDLAIKFGCHQETARNLVRRALEALVKVYDGRVANAQPEWEA